MAVDEPVLDARGLRRGEATLDIAMRRGEVVALVGADEQEKTRWLRVLAGLRRSDGGSLHICGEDVLAGRFMPHRKSGYLSAGAPLLSTFDVIANVMLPRLYHFHEAPLEARRHAVQLLQQTGFAAGNVLPAALDRLSSFQAMLARALAMNPALLFVHEPFDITLAPHWNRIEAALLAGTETRALVIATQNLGFVQRRAQRVIFVHDGAVQLFGSWDAFRDGGEAVAAYLAAMPKLFEEDAA